MDESTAANSADVAVTLTANGRAERIEQVRPAVYRYVVCFFVTFVAETADSWMTLRLAC